MSASCCHLVVTSSMASSTSPVLPTEWLLKGRSVHGAPARGQCFTYYVSLLISTLERGHYYSHFIDRRIEAQRSVVRAANRGKDETRFFIY